MRRGHTTPSAFGVQHAPTCLLCWLALLLVRVAERRTAFRDMKSTLALRPVYHRLQRRIQVLVPPEGDLTGGQGRVGGAQK